MATDTHDFPSSRKDGCIYVDKTKFMHSLLTTKGAKPFFMSRPRRFGKSLTVSAFKALFQGRRELFEGLTIEKLDWSWETDPVIHFEFNDISVTSIDEFKLDLQRHIAERLADAGYAYDTSMTTHFNFAKAIETLSAATWATTGRPSMLMNYLKREDVLRIDLECMRGIDVTEFDVAGECPVERPRRLVDFAVERV